VKTYSGPENFARSLASSSSVKLGDLQVSIDDDFSGEDGDDR